MLLPNTGQLFRGLCPLLLNDGEPCPIQCLHGEPGNCPDESPLPIGESMRFPEGHIEHADGLPLYLQRQRYARLNATLNGDAPEIGITLQTVFGRFNPDLNSATRGLGNHVHGVQRDSAVHERPVFGALGLVQTLEQSIGPQETNRCRLGAESLRRDPRHHRHDVLGRAGHGQGSGNFLQGSQTHSAGVPRTRQLPSDFAARERSRGALLSVERVPPWPVRCRHCRSFESCKA